VVGHRGSELSRVLDQLVFESVRRSVSARMVPAAMSACLALTVTYKCRIGRSAGTLANDYLAEVIKVACHRKALKLPPPWMKDGLTRSRPVGRNEKRE
jgi:hypothetical protein